MPGLCLAGESPATQGFSLLQQHSQTESSAAAPADNDKPGEASHRERDRKNWRGETGWTDSEETRKRNKRRGLQQQCNSEPHGPSSLATTQRVHPTITSPLHASQPGAPCNCVSHQPAITFKRVALEAGDIRNPDWPRPGLCLYTYKSFSPASRMSTNTRVFDIISP